MADTLIVNEIFLSLQGESAFVGLPCIFVRLTACNLRCSYCDTAYAFSEGKPMRLSEVRAEVHRLAAAYGAGAAGASPGAQAGAGAENGGNAAGAPQPLPATRASSPPYAGGHALPLVELTGGEPLLQKNSRRLMIQLCDDGFVVLLETGGSLDISAVDPRVRRIMDIKCPSSGEVLQNRWENLRHLGSADQVKFVIGSVEDYAWAKQKIAELKLAAVCPLLFSWAHPLTAKQKDKSLKKVPRGQTPISQQELAERIIADALPVRYQTQLHKIIWPPDRRGV
jgi:7-carboxy-7-deazaguanine synthase